MSLIIGSMFLAGLYWIFAGLANLFSKGAPKEQDTTRFFGVIQILGGLIATAATWPMFT